MKWRKTAARSVRGMFRNWIMEAMSVYVRIQPPVNLGMRFKPNRKGPTLLTTSQ